jgi:hypothetical protein
VASTGALITQLGVVACTLTYLFSLRHPDNASHDNINGSKQTSSMALTFVSLSCTVLNFTINLVGVSNVLTAARNAVRRVSEATRRFSENGARCTGARQERPYSARVVPERVELVMGGDELLKHGVTDAGYRHRTSVGGYEPN